MQVSSKARMHLQWSTGGRNTRVLAYKEECRLKDEDARIDNPYLNIHHLRHLGFTSLTSIFIDHSLAANPQQ